MHNREYFAGAANRLFFELWLRNGGATATGMTLGAAASGEAAATSGTGLDKTGRYLSIHERLKIGVIVFLLIPRPVRTFSRRRKSLRKCSSPTMPLPKSSPVYEHQVGFSNKENRIA